MSDTVVLTPEPQQATPIAPSHLEPYLPPQPNQTQQQAQPNDTTKPQAANAQSDPSIARAEQFANIGAGNAPASLSVWGDAEPATREPLFPASPSPAPTAPVEPARPAAISPIPDLDESTVEPSIAAAFKAVKAQNEQLSAWIQNEQRQREEASIQQVEHIKREIDRRATAAVKELPQDAAGKVLKRAGHIIKGMIASGEEMPAVETIVGWAKAIEGKQTAQPAQQPYSFPPNNPSQIGGNAAAKNVRVSKRNDPFGLFGDANVQAIFREAQG